MTQVTSATSTAPVAPYKVDVMRGGHDGSVSSQWCARPHDQRFLSLDDLHDFKRKFWEDSFQTRTASSDVELLPPGEIKSVADLNKLTCGIKIDRGDRTEVREVSPTNHAFRQLCGLAKAPASFLQDELPSPLVADVLNWRLQHSREVEEIKLYGGTEQLYAATGPEYGRIPDYQVVEAVRAIAGSGRGEMRWKIPGVLNWSNGTYDPEAKVTKESTTLYASDRDCFMFLVDDRNPIEVGKTAKGDPDLMFRGFYVQNSEMGARSLKIACFYLRGVCMNRNLWGVEGYEDLIIRHTRQAPSRWVEQAVPALNSYANNSDRRLLAGVQLAKEAKVAADHEEAISFLSKRKFSVSKARDILKIGEKEEDKEPRTIWDFGQAITAYARNLPNTDDRLDMELVAKEVFDLVKVPA